MSRTPRPPLPGYDPHAETAVMEALPDENWDKRSPPKSPLRAPQKSILLGVIVFLASIWGSRE